MRDEPQSVYILVLVFILGLDAVKFPDENQEVRASFELHLGSPGSRAPGGGPEGIFRGKPAGCVGNMARLTLLGEDRHSLAVMAPFFPVGGLGLRAGWLANMENNILCVAMDGAHDVGIDLDMSVDCLTHNNVHPDSPQSFNMEPDSGGEKRKGDDNSDDDYEDGNPEKKLRMNHDDFRDGYTTVEHLVGVTGDPSLPTDEDDLQHVSGSTLEQVEDSMTTAVQLATTSGQQIQARTKENFFFLIVLSSPPIVALFFLSQLLEVSGMDSSPATPSSDKTEEAAPVNQAWFTTKEDKTSLHGKGTAVL
ncbi:Hypp3312 [Branchiostoma lanceolatum]|uniref:Hypp3312 protein n=1 Tax=Branchiostoma lanceolatum TaxID=7740 RepID=A0A8J9ZZ12_BRALA|nr:Hypp3312 [Branchiostoma lanceolatum]